MKNWVSVILAFLLITAAASGSRAARAEDSSASKERTAAHQAADAGEKKRAQAAGQKERSILTELDAIDRDIQAGKAELAEQQRKLREAETALRDIEKNNSAISRELDGLKKAYARRLRALYKMSQERICRRGIRRRCQGDALKRIKYLGIIAERDHAIIRDYGSCTRPACSAAGRDPQKKAQLLERKRAIEAKKTELEARKRKKAVFLASVREEKGVYEQTLRELEESSASLWAMVKKTGAGAQGAEDRARRVPKSAARRLRTEAASLAGWQARS